MKKETSLPLLLNTYTVDFNSDRQKRKRKKEIKGIQIRKGERKLFLFTDDRTLYVENPK